MEMVLENRGQVCSLYLNGRGLTVCRPACLACSAHESKMGVGPRAPVPGWLAGRHAWIAGGGSPLSGLGGDWARKSLRCRLPSVCRSLSVSSSRCPRLWRPFAIVSSIQLDTGTKQGRLPSDCTVSVVTLPSLSAVAVLRTFLCTVQGPSQEIMGSDHRRLSLERGFTLISFPL